MTPTTDYLFDMVFGTPTIRGVPSSIPRMAPNAPVHPWGPGYSIHPELSRPGVGYLMRAALTNPLIMVPAATVVGSVMILDAQRYVVEQFPEEQRPSIWSGFSQALTGGVGIGTGHNFV